jgi:hypothetical protein
MDDHSEDNSTDERETESDSGSEGVAPDGEPVDRYRRDEDKVDDEPEAVEFDLQEWDEEVVEARLACDAEFAERYFALVELARTAAPGADIFDLARAIIGDDQMLRRRMDASDREARRFRIKERFRKKVQFGFLRRLDGAFSPLPETLPARRSACDRIFPSWETLSWELVVGDPEGIWMPVRKWLTKRTISAMVGLRESSIDAYMRKGFLNRIPRSHAPVADEACFWTHEVMAWRRMVNAMRDYEPPPAIVRGKKRFRVATLAFAPQSRILAKCLRESW